MFCSICVTDFGLNFSFYTRTIIRNMWMCTKDGADL